MAWKRYGQSSNRLMGLLRLRLLPYPRGPRIRRPALYPRQRLESPDVPPESRADLVSVLADVRFTRLAA